LNNEQVCREAAMQALLYVGPGSGIVRIRLQVGAVLIYGF